jgi:hypothetical protein
VVDLAGINDEGIQDTEIIKYCQSVSNAVRSKLLSEFLQRFEQHLEKEDVSDAQSEEDWVAFIAVSKGWLLAYSLVAILPLASRNVSATRVLDRYRESLDEILMPLWGRFHFHLQHARESLSREQVLWTFQYAVQFVSLLANMLESMLSAGKLKVVCDADYRSAGTSHIVDKVVRAMRAHIAVVLVNCGQGSAKDDFDATVLVLIESALELDRQLQLAAPNKGRELYLSNIFVEAPSSLQAWLRSDYEYFRQAMLGCAGDAYAFKFHVHGAGFPSRCYFGVHRCLSLLTTALCRYQYLAPRSAKDKFSHYILEPLLLSGMGVLLFKLRHDPVLQSILEERSCDDLQIEARSGLPKALGELLDSSAYFVEAMRNAVTPHSHSSSDRIPHKWKMLQPWVKSAAYANLRPAAVVEKAFDSFEGCGATYTLPTAATSTTCNDAEYAVVQMQALSMEIDRQFKELFASPVYRKRST